MTGVLDTAAFVRFEANGWDRVAEVYHRFFGAITGRALDPLLEAGAVGPGSRVLDVATGPGYAAVRAVARGAVVTGVDIAPAILDIARRLCPGVTLRTADAHDLPFDDGSFDSVVANFLVPHLGDHRQAVAEFVRVIAPGGRLALSTWDRPERSPLLGVMVEAAGLAGAAPPRSVPAGPDFFTFSDDETFAGLLGQGGLHDVTVQRLVFTHRVRSAADLWDGLLEGTVRTAALVSGQTPQVQREIRAVFDSIVERFRSGGVLAVPVSVKIAAGRKPA